ADLAGGKVEVSREKSIRGDELFSKRYGYVEQRVASVDELRHWLDQVDDVTHVDVDYASVVLGGRQFDALRPGGGELEGGAALYQAHVKLAEEREAVAARAGGSLIDEFNRIVQMLNMERRGASYYGSYSIERASLDALASRIGETIPA